MATQRIVIGIVVTACIVFALQGCSASRTQKDVRDGHDVDVSGGTIVTGMGCELIEVVRFSGGSVQVDRGSEHDNKAVKIQPPGK